MVILFALAVYLIGLSLPVKHTATVTATIKSPPDAVWRRVTTFAEYPSWRKNVRSVETVSPNEWVETDDSGDKIPYRITVLEDKKKAKVEITGQDLQFGGHWIIELNGKGDATEVTITENGEVYNALFRVMSKFIFGHDATIKQYLHYLVL
ncbi:MAG: SRPBCC family protein [Pyrinomonadaceae bacterium]